MAAPRPKWLLQITPTDDGLRRNPGWRNWPHHVLIYDKADRDRRVAEAEQALWCGDIAAFRCDRI